MFFCSSLMTSGFCTMEYGLRTDAPLHGSNGVSLVYSYKVAVNHSLTQCTAEVLTNVFHSLSIVGTLKSAMVIIYLTTVSSLFSMWVSQGALSIVKNRISTMGSNTIAQQLQTFLNADKRTLNLPCIFVAGCTQTH